MPKKITAESLGLRNLDTVVPQITTAMVEDAIAVPKLAAEVISEKKVTLNRAKALEYIDLPVFPGERQVVEGHVQFLHDEMRKGTFNERLVILSTGLMSSVTYKVNGQHTCWAMLFMPPSYSLQVTELYRICIVAWNRWRRGEQVQVLKPTKERLKPV